MQAAHVAALHAAAGCTRSVELNPPVWAERVFVLHAATTAQLTGALDGHWTPGMSGSAPAGDGAVSWFVEPDRFFELTAVCFEDPALLEPLSAAPLWSPPAADPGSFEHRDEVRPLLAAAERRGLDGSDVWGVAAGLGDPAAAATRRRALWICARDREPPLE